MVLVDFVCHLELRPEIGRVDLAREVAVAEVDPGVFVDLAAEELGAVGAFLAEDLGLLVELRVVDDYRSSFAHRVVLGLVEGVAAEVADGAEGPAFICAHHALRSVLDDHEPVTARDVHDGVHLAGYAGVVHAADDLGPVGYGRLNPLLVDVHGVRSDVGENKARAAEDRRVRGAGEGVAREDYLISGPQLAELESHVKGG